MALQNISQFFSHSFLSDSPLTKTLGEEFVLCDNGNMIFHWADFFETCDLVKTQMESDPELMKDFKNREDSLNRLNLIPVWVRTENKIHQTTMHELYERYILNQTHLMVGVDPFYPIEISFISGTGPFKGMSIAECFNKATYRDFVLVYLLKGKLPRRDFRIRLKAKILMEFGKEYKNAELISIEQITMNGLLFSLESEMFMKKISSGESVRMLINTKMLSEGIGKDLPGLKTHLSQYAFNLLYSSKKEDGIMCTLKDFSVQSSFDFARNKRIYLFVSYEKLQQSHSQSVKNLQEFVNHTRELVRGHYQSSSEKSKTA